MNNSTVVFVVDAYCICNEGSISGTIQPPKFATRVRTCSAITIHELSAIFDPLVHGVPHGVESWGPPFVRGLFPRTVDDELGIIGCGGGGDGGDSQSSKPDEPLERCLHAGQAQSRVWPSTLTGFGVFSAGAVNYIRRG